MIEAFGAEAERWARGLDPSVPVILCQIDTVAAAWPCVVRRRRAGSPFLLGVHLEDRRERLAAVCSLQTFQTVDDIDARRAQFVSIGTEHFNAQGVAAPYLTYYAATQVNALRDLVKVADGMIFRSEAERRRLHALIGYERPYAAVVPIVDERIAEPAGPPGDAVVLYAPDRQAADLVVYAEALDESLDDVFAICHGTPPRNARFTVVPPADAVSALRRAAVVLDATATDPAAALALARAGFHVASASTTGAAEFIDGIVTFDPWHETTIREATSRARGATPLVRPLPDGVARVTEVLERAAPPASGPPVTIVVPTYNRRALLPTLLAALQAQTYADLEILVVNDAGEPVDDVVARYSRARLLTLQKNQGLINVLKAGFAAARGEYVGAISDDDICYPDFVARTAHALTTSGRDVAHANVLLRRDRRTPDGTHESYGFRTIWDQALDRSIIPHANQFNQLAVVMRRDVVRDGHYREGLGTLADWEFSLRLAKQYEFVHVDAVCGEMSVATDGSNWMFSPDALVEMTLLYDLHPVPGRPILEQKRIGTRQYQLRMITERLYEEPYVSLDPPLPLPAPSDFGIPVPV